MASWDQRGRPPHERLSRTIAIAFLLVLLIVLALAVDSKAAVRHHRRPRAAAVLMPLHQTWICPDLPGDVPVVHRDVCFVIGWPEPEFG